MKQEIRFKTPEEAIRYAYFYNREGVRTILHFSRLHKMHGKVPTPKEMHIYFSFAGIQGYPVTAIIDRWSKKGLCQPNK